jgi:hypothetical protein
MTPKYFRRFGLPAGRAVREVLARDGCCNCLYLVLANYSTHKTAAIKDWLVTHLRFHLYFTPASSSWLNGVPLIPLPSV